MSPTPKLRAMVRTRTRARSKRAGCHSKAMYRNRTDPMQLKQSSLAKCASLILAALVIVSCSQGLPSHGTYDAVLPNQTVITLRIERLDQGRVEGNLQSTGVNLATDTVVNLPVSSLSGEVFRHNISLKSTSPTEPVTYLGQFNSDTITLNVGDEATIFHMVNAKQHSANLSEVQRKASGLRDFHARQTVLAKVQTQIAAQQKELSDYVQWEPRFTQDVAGIQRWYAAQLSTYQQCLTTIRAEAAAKIPRWRWQECALQVSVASYARQQMLQNISAVESKQTSMASSIAQAIANTPSVLSVIRVQTKGLLANCKYATDPVGCERLFGQATKMNEAQKILYSPEDVSSFQTFQSTAHHNLATLGSIRVHEAVHLDALSTDIAAVYSHAN